MSPGSFSYTIEDLVYLLGSTENSRGLGALIGQIQRWQKLGAFGAREPQRGQARTFTLADLRVACVLNELAKIGVASTAATRMLSRNWLRPDTELTFRHSVDGATVTVSTKHYAPAFVALVHAKRENAND